MSAAEDNPFRPPSVPSAADANNIMRIPEERAVFVTTAKVGNQEYRVLAFDDRLQILSAKGDAFEKLRTEPLFCKLVDTWFVKRGLQVKHKKPVLLLFQKEGFKQLKDWIGLPTKADLKWATGGHSYWQLIVGLLFLIGWDTYGLVIGIALIACWGVSRVRPHRGLFLLYSVFFIAATFINGQHAYDAFNENQNLPIVAILCGLFCLSGSIRYFQNFGKYRELRESTATLTDSQ